MTIIQEDEQELHESTNTIVTKKSKEVQPHRASSRALQAKHEAMNIHSQSSLKSSIEELISHHNAINNRSASHRKDSSSLQTQNPDLAHIEAYDLNMKQIMGPECFELVDVPSESHGSTNQRKETDPTGCFQTMNSQPDAPRFELEAEEKKVIIEEEERNEMEGHGSQYQLKTSYYQTGAENDVINLSKLSEVMVDSNDPYVRTNPYVETNKRSSHYNEEPISPSGLVQTNEQQPEEIPANVHIEQVIADMDQIEEIKLKTEGSSSMGKGPQLSENSKSELEVSP